MSESLRGTGRTSRMLVEAISAARAAPDANVLVVMGTDEQRGIHRHIAALSGATPPNIVVVSLDIVERGWTRGGRWAAMFEDHTVAEERERRARTAQVRYPEQYAALLAAGNQAATVVHPEADITSPPSPAPKGANPIRLKVAVSVDALARLLFETDEEVIAHVRCVSEFRVKGCTTDEMRAAILRRDDAMQRCFDRGSSGDSPEWRWFVRASDRAEAMTARIRGGQ